MENVPIWHYRSPNKDEYQQAHRRAGDGRAMRNTFRRDAVRGGDDQTPTSTSSSPTSRRPAAWRSSASNIPSAFINVGVAEQSMIGICAGLALKGCQPFAYTIATFSLYRPFEMVRDDLVLSELAGDRGRHGRRRDLFDAGRHPSHAGGHRHHGRDAQHADHRALRSRRDRGGDVGLRRRRTGRSICASARPASRISPPRPSSRGCSASCATCARAAMPA